MMLPHSVLPIESELDRIRGTLRSHDSLILSAEPGAGKSTLVPLALLNEDWTRGRRIVMLEPRRIAACAAATRMAALIGERVGEQVGFRTRAETVVGPKTRIEVVTEAILTRMFQHDPELPDTALVIFDEFHERGIYADLGLALALDVRANLRPDLKLLLMSATLDLPALTRLLPDAATISVPGAVFPVRTIYSDAHPELPIERRAAFTLKNALMNFPGDALVFLPGEGEIHRAIAAFQDYAENLPFPVEVLPLFGNLPPEKQNRVFAAKNDPAARRAIFATSIAETSLTVDGVRMVIDSGLMRIPRFDPAAGMDRLETLPVALASADQRRGRAGRTAEGVCIRLWRETDERGMSPFRAPEIFETDLSELALELAAWGVRREDVAAFPFPDPPPESHLRQAWTLLRELDAVDANGHLTAHGRGMLAFPVHPRLSHMILSARPLGCTETAVALASLLSERDFLRVSSADLTLRLDSLSQKPDPASCDMGARSRILELIPRLRRLVPREGKFVPPALDRTRAGAILLAFAYPDRVARKNRIAEDFACTLANGLAAELPAGDDLLAGSEFLAVGATGTMNGKTKIRLAAALDLSEIETYLANRIETRFETEPDRENACVRAEKIRALGSLVLERKKISDPPAEALLPAFLELVRRTGPAALTFSKNTHAFCERSTFLHAHGIADFPDLSEASLMAHLDIWLAPWVAGFKRLSELAKLDFGAILENIVPARSRAKMNALAPEKIEVPSGSHIRVDYSDPARPKLSVRLQELFGMKATPRLAGGAVPLLMDILSPAQRTVQRTCDLESFWKDSYFLVRKDMRGRYPKHDWPEDPLSALPHRGVRKVKM